LRRSSTTLEGLTCDRRLRLSVEKLGNRAAGVPPRDSSLLATVMAVRRELGLEPLIESGSTDANAAIGLGIEALGLGVSRGRDMHTTRESIDIDSLELGEKQVELVLGALLAG
jgi:tripeptide aminopeptidase